MSGGHAYAAFINTLYFILILNAGAPFYLKQCGRRPPHMSYNQKKKRKASYRVVTVYCSDVYLKLLLLFVCFMIYFLLICIIFLTSLGLLCLCQRKVYYRAKRNEFNNGDEKKLLRRRCWSQVQCGSGSGRMCFPESLLTVRREKTTKSAYFTLPNDVKCFMRWSRATCWRAGARLRKSGTARGGGKQPAGPFCALGEWEQAACSKWVFI